MVFVMCKWYARLARANVRALVFTIDWRCGVWYDLILYGRVSMHECSNTLWCICLTIRESYSRQHSYAYYVFSICAQTYHVHVWYSQIFIHELGIIELSGMWVNKYVLHIHRKHVFRKFIIWTTIVRHELNQHVFFVTPHKGCQFYSKYEHSFAISSFTFERVSEGVLTIAID